VRLVPALAGVLAVFTTYLAAKEIVNGQWSIANRQSSLRQSEIRNLIPLFAAFFMAILLPAIHFSRFGLRMMPFVVVETLVVYFFWRGVNGAKMRSMGDKNNPSTGSGQVRQSSTFSFSRWPGSFWGWACTCYAAGRVLPLLFVVFVPLVVLAGSGGARRLWRQWR
jgi:asparagine N-glycosylation enzyme membrane subunit Stt3